MAFAAAACALFDKTMDEPERRWKKKLNGNSALSPSFAALLPSPTLVLVGVPQARRKNLIDLREKHRR